MESIDRLITLLIQFTLVAAGLFLILKALRFRHHLKLKSELQRMQAHVSQLRISLKSKVKKRGNAFRLYFSKGILPGSDLDFQISALIENRFETGNDFKNYFDQVRETFAAATKFPVTAETPYDFFLKTDEEIELAIFRLIKQIKETSAKFNVKADAFRKLHVKNKVNFLDPLQFAEVSEIEIRIHLADQNQMNEIDKKAA